MTDIPILFSAPMIRALLEGRKTQTRRVLKLRGHRTFSEFGPSDTTGYDWHFRDSEMRWHDYRHADLLRLLPYTPGDRVWVREAWNVPDAYLLPENRETALGLMNYRATPWAEPGAWRSPIHMPRWASRLTLTVTDVRVQRVQEISEADARAEGIEQQFYGGTNPEYVGHSGWRDYRNHPHAVVPFKSPIDSFATLWNSIHGPDAWERNDLVIARTFTVHNCNIDRLEAA